MNIDKLIKNYDDYTLQERHTFLKKLNKLNINDHRINDHRINKLNDIHKIDIHYHGIRNLSLLTIINLIALPIGIIVGYFGINFNNVSTGKNNILSIKNPQLFILLCCIISSSICVYLFNIYYDMFNLDNDNF